MEPAARPQAGHGFTPHSGGLAARIGVRGTVRWVCGVCAVAVRDFQVARSNPSPSTESTRHLLPGL